MAGTVVADTLQAASTSTLVLKNGVANTPPTIQDSAGTEIGTFCRAWVNFDGTTNTGGFCTIRGSFNVSSVADNGTGDYTVNFTTAMPDANYTPVCFGNRASAAQAPRIPLIRTNGTLPTTSALRIEMVDTSATGLSDQTYVNIAVFR
jgi:hypothetical protein